MTLFLKELLLPPGILILIGIIGVLMINRNPRRARHVLLFAAACLYVLSMKAVAGLLMTTLPEQVPLTPERIAGDAEAIVILGAGLYPAAPEYGGDTVSGGSLVRLRYGARLHRLSGKPVLVSGGRPEKSELSEAETMRDALEADFNVAAAWLEEESENTLEAARNCFDILEREGIGKILLVTHASHMGRAAAAFASAGFEVVPAPTAFWSHPKLLPRDFLPTAGGLAISRLVIHEWLGRLWYWVRS